jgi:hypothetical protein
MMYSTYLLRTKSYISPDDGEYVSSQVKIIYPSFGELYDFDMRRHVLSII